MAEELHLDAYERVRQRFLERVRSDREAEEDLLANTLPAETSGLEEVGSAVDAILHRTEGDVRHLLGRAAIKERRRKLRRSRTGRLPVLAVADTGPTPRRVSSSVVAETNLELRLASNYELRSLPALFDAEVVFLCLNH